MKLVLKDNAVDNAGKKNEVYQTLTEYSELEGIFKDHRDQLLGEELIQGSNPQLLSQVPFSSSCLPSLVAQTWAEQLLLLTASDWTAQTNQSPHQH